MCTKSDSMLDIRFVVFVFVFVFAGGGGVFLWCSFSSSSLVVVDDCRRRRSDDDMTRTFMSDDDDEKNASEKCCSKFGGMSPEREREKKEGKKIRAFCVTKERITCVYILCVSHRRRLLRAPPPRKIERRW